MTWTWIGPGLLVAGLLASKLCAALAERTTRPTRAERRAARERQEQAMEAYLRALLAPAGEDR